MFTDCRDDVTKHELGRTLAAIGLLEDAFMITGLAALTRGAVLSTDTLHLEPSTDCACPARGSERGSTRD